MHARRGDGEEEINLAHTELRAARKDLRAAINSSKRNAWAQITREVENDVYGQGYKIVAKGLRVLHPPLTLSQQDREEQISRLFPEAEKRAWRKTPVEEAEIPLFTTEEMRTATNKLKNGKAPGRDGIPAEVVKVAVEELGEDVLAVMNGLLRAGRFPLGWKAAKIVLIEKERKRQDQPATYRPLCLIDAPAKLYEHLLLRRLVEEVDRHGGFSSHQHGFRQGHSTVTAVEEVLRHSWEAHRAHPSRWCLLVLIDVRNAFNTAAWDKIIGSLEKMEIPPYLINVIKDYLTDRAIYKEKSEWREVNVGVPQGSVLGPTLWNIMYDGVLKVEIPEGTQLTAYADDLAILATHKDLRTLERRTNTAIDAVARWLRDNGLEIAPEKTEAIFLKYGRRKHVASILVDGLRVETQGEVKYLGVALDGAVSFGPHIRAAAAKAERTVTALSRLMPNVGGGASEGRRRMLCSAAHSIMLYGAPIWAGAMGIAALLAVQRKMALRVCRAYRTVSSDAAMVLSSLIPVHLLAEERKAIYLKDPADNVLRERERIRTLDRWQAEWASGTKGSWTRRLIRDVRIWLRRPHGELDFHLTQGLSGHGAFKAYTKRIGKTQEESCEGCSVPDTAEHAIFYCTKYAAIRLDLHTAIGEVMTPDNMVDVMLRTANNWEAVRKAVGRIVSHKEEEERAAGAGQGGD